MKTLRSLALAVLAILAAAGTAGAAEPLKLNVIMTLTGGGAFLGQGEKTALEIAEHAVNASGGIRGRPIEFEYYDSQTSPQIAVQLENQILGSKPAVILGSTIVADCRAMAPLVKNGPVEYCLTPGFHPEPGGYVFSSSVSTLDQIQVTIRYLRLKGCTRLAFLSSTDATGQDADQGLADALKMPENQGIALVNAAHFNPGDVSVAAQIATLKAAGPQCLIAWTTGAPVATIFRAVLDAGLDIPLATTGGNMTYRQMEQFASYLPPRLYFGSTEWVLRDPNLLKPQEVEAHDTFYKAFEAAGQKPDVSSELAWDPAFITVDALRTLGPDATGKELHDYLERLKGHAGINGIYDFTAIPQRGVGAAASVVTEWSRQDQTWRVVSKPGGDPL